jgi:hypothetical protein
VRRSVYQIYQLFVDSSFVQAADRFPILDRYHKSWVTRDFIRCRLKYTSGRERVKRLQVQAGKRKVSLIICTLEVELNPNHLTFEFEGATKKAIVKVFSISLDRIYGIHAWTRISHVLWLCTINHSVFLGINKIAQRTYHYQCDHTQSQ